MDVCHDHSVPSERNALIRSLKLPLAAAAAVLAIALAGCSPAATGVAAGASLPTAAEPAAAADAAVVEPVAATGAPGEPAEHLVTVQVTGKHPRAMVKTVVTTASGKESGGPMQEQKLPYTHELTIVEGQAFTKILVVAKYSDGASGTLSCSITVDGEEASAASATERKPATCQFLRPAGK